MAPLTPLAVGPESVAYSLQLQKLNMRPRRNVDANVNCKIHGDFPRLFDRHLDLHNVLEMYEEVFFGANADCGLLEDAEIPKDTVAQLRRLALEPAGGAPATGVAAAAARRSMAVPWSYLRGQDPAQGHGGREGRGRLQLQLQPRSPRGRRAGQVPGSGGRRLAEVKA
ncbi:hypothetical protein VOLCADRAFT_87962 [Volvox carteri f. nagariensis]|uniref:Uncharacterized protein n=1 Tax=Volvox carteri f. nagariensis TaxID=3068 RepID=D8TMQ2_VOLCA|nr:uncharacterized protein VOLCADRAFT_87962 [Volvox carteri f. nagariensis]EFJ51293.1 hypothetical protein VOLCADRAFT_87962 [Volvox carteri f. nagariensis]|eukprot:XP_002947760.1 hypothetical protein VOLCADRAFT_87962 [Volvox carteri f. nagariensis]